MRILAALIALAGSGATAAAGSLTLTTEEAPPYSQQQADGIHGIAADGVAELMRRAGQPYRMTLRPWQRAYQEALTDRQTCVFATVRTPEREPHFKWVGPIAVMDWVLYALVARHLHLRTLDEARALTIGSYNADVRDSFLRARGFRVDSVWSNAHNPQRLANGRIDLWASDPYVAYPLIVAAGLAGKIEPVLTFQHSELYLACNRGVDDVRIDRLNRLLQTMAHDGTLALITHRYAGRSH